jgi:sigma-B regulation protein RsbU (phosphoserine phosphatase)
MERKIVRYLDHLIVVTGEKERTRTELSIAAQIQSDMLPSQFPAFPDREQDFDLYASMAPAKEVGGDFYDFFLVDDDHLALTIADVSGKGIPGAMFMAIVKSLLKNSVASNKDMAPSEVIASLNDRICQNNQSGLFVSVWLGILELSTGTLTACNAGHEYPVLSRKGQPFALMKDKHGLVMAAESGASYSDYQIVLAPGDRLFVYTDGVVEATNKKTELFGIDRMIEALNSDPKARPRELIEEVSAAVDEFVGSAPQFDDMTMLSITYKP